MLDTLCDVLKTAYQRTWISSRDGNFSYRRKGEPFVYVSPSGVRKQHLNSEMVIKLELLDELCFNDLSIDVPTKRVTTDESQQNNIGLKPTGELHLHLLLQSYPVENRCILHLHPSSTIGAMYAGLDLQFLATEFPEINRYTKVGPTVPVIPPITKDLALASVKALGLKEDGTVEYDIIGLNRHGVVAIGKDAWTAFEHVERLEHICQIALAAQRK